MKGQTGDRGRGTGAASLCMPVSGQDIDIITTLPKPGLSAGLHIWLVLWYTFFATTFIPEPRPRPLQQINVLIFIVEK